MGSIQELFSNVIRIITFVGGGLAVVYMLYGFVRYIMASGNPQAVDAAKSTIVQAAIGLVGIGGIAILLNVLVQVLPGGAGQNIAGILPDTSTSGQIPGVTSIGTTAAAGGGAVVVAGGPYIQLTFDSPIKVEGNPAGLQILITRTTGQQFLVGLEGCGGTAGKTTAICAPAAGVTTLVFGQIHTTKTTQCVAADGCTVNRFQFNGVPVRSIAGNANIDPTIPAHPALIATTAAP